MKRAALLALALAACTAAPAQDRPALRTSADFPKPQPGERILLNQARAIDGDTLRADDLEIRLFSVDTPEMFSRSRCPEEKAAGIAAKDFVQTRIDAAREVVALVAQRREDQYGRTLANVQIDGADLGTLLMANGHAKTYRAGGYDWCADLVGDSRK